MAGQIEIRDLGDVEIDDPAEVERINKLERSADQELVRRQARKKPPLARPLTSGERSRLS